MSLLQGFVACSGFTLTGPRYLMIVSIHSRFKNRTPTQSRTRIATQSLVLSKTQLRPTSANQRHVCENVEKPLHAVQLSSTDNPVI